MPADYVNKLARMFQDIKVSEDLNQVFKEMHKHNRLALPGTRLTSAKTCQENRKIILHFTTNLASSTYNVCLYKM